MKPLALVGVLLIILGGGALLFGRFSYTTDTPVVEVGPLKASVSERHTVALPDMAGIGLLVLGGVLVVLALRRA